MATTTVLTGWPIRLACGLVVGAGIASVDNILFEGEVSPIIIVSLLLATTFAAGAMWGRRSLVATVAMWAWVPAAHLTKRVLGLPDTLHPNTNISLLLLAIFTLAVAGVGTLCGCWVRNLALGGANPAEPGASAGSGE
jgi:hypothetical protein